jgi:hypothetical protein
MPAEQFQISYSRSFSALLLFSLVLSFTYGCGSLGTFGSDDIASSGAPPSPLKVTATPVPGTSGVIQIDWLPQPTANIHYTVFESTTPLVSPLSYEDKRTNIQIPPFAYTGLASGTTYYFVVTTDDNFLNLQSPPSTPAASAVAP